MSLFTSPIWKNWRLRGIFRLSGNRCYPGKSGTLCGLRRRVIWFSGRSRNCEATPRISRSRRITGDPFAQLESIDPAERCTPSEFHPNYEAHHPPLAYFILAIRETFLSNRPLLTRIRVLRILCVLLGGVLMGAAAWYARSSFGLSSPYFEAMLFVIFSSQMFYATAARTSRTIGLLCRWAPGFSRRRFDSRRDRRCCCPRSLHWVF